MRTKKKVRMLLKEIALKIPQVLWEKHLQEVPQRQYTPVLTTTPSRPNHKDNVQYKNDIC